MTSRVVKDVSADPHRRYDPLRDEWVLVSPGRTARPWSGHVETTPQARPAAYDPDCYLCPGNERSGGERNPEYESTFVFTNDFAALRPNSPTWDMTDGLRRAQGVAGTCRVVCFSPRHDVSLGEMAVTDVRRVIDTWADQTTELGRGNAYVQVFENRGSAMGASNPHPHGQIWAGSGTPFELGREQTSQQAYGERATERLLIDYERQERDSERMVVAGDSWSVVVPYWAVWPYETLVLPRLPVRRLAELEGAERDELAAVLIGLLRAYDDLFGVPFPYSMGWHQAPFSGPVDGWQLHAHFYPPLLRSADVRKFMVGYELLAEPQRDLTPEEAAARLRDRVRP